MTLAKERGAGERDVVEGEVFALPDWSPIGSLTRKELAIVSIVVVGVFLVAAIVPYILGWTDEQTLRRWGIPGIFVANFVSTAAIIPVPGLAAMGQLLVVAGASTLWLPGLFVAALLGMTLGESTAYLAGFGGRHIASDADLPLEDTRVGDWMRKAAGWINEQMQETHKAVPIITILSGVPNPFFDVVGIAAGATRMNFLLFLVAAGIGDAIRIALLIYLGDQFLDFTDFGV